jgi:hypothetical protein
MNNLRYERVLPVTKKELVSQLESQDPEIVASALYAATRYEEDWRWVQDKCIEYLESPEVSIRWAAATCLGDLALFRRPLDVERVAPALELAIQDSTIADPASFSLSMVKEFSNA